MALDHENAAPIPDYQSSIVYTPSGSTASNDPAYNSARSVGDSESPTACTPSTTSASTTHATNAQPPQSSVPWPGSTFIIQCASTRKALTFHNGCIELLPITTHAAMRWKCVENGGWIGFQDPASNMFLGYDKDGVLCCQAKKQQEWENFCVRQRPEGGYVLLVTHYDNVLVIAWKVLRPVGMRVVEGRERLGKVWNEGDEVVWQFVKV